MGSLPQNTVGRNSVAGTAVPGGRKRRLRAGPDAPRAVVGGALAGGLVLVALIAAQPARAASLPDVKLILALTETTQHPPVTSFFLHDSKSGMRREVYRDGEEERRVLVKIAASDVLHAARSVGGSTIYAMRGPAEVEPGATCPDTLSRLRLGPSEDQAEWEAVLFVPLCFSDASPYGLWNRAPIFAVSSDGSRIALPALRIGDERLDRPTIRILSSEGAEEWRLPLPGEWMEVADLAWSPDAKQLAYLILPQGDEHTVDEAQLSKAGVYLADITARSARRISDCQARSLAWGPNPNEITIASGGPAGGMQAGVISVLRLPGGRRVEEFSVKGSPLALAYSPDLHWLAVETIKGDQQTVWLYHVLGGWGRRVHQLPTSAGRLSLVGWAADSVAEAGT